MNNLVYVFSLTLLLVGFICKTLFEYLLDMDNKKYADMDMELMKAIEEEKEEQK